MIELSERLSQLPPAKRQLLQQRLRRDPSLAEPVAVVGIGCRFPGAPDLDRYWQLIAGGEEATGEIPASRWDIDAFYDPSGQTDGKMSTRWGAFLEDVDRFDALFFGIAPREAKKIDPQQRLLLEVAWEALEHAGVAPDRLAGSNGGVFIGIGGTDYSKVPTQFADYYEHVDAHCGTGNALSIAANRLSYLLDLHGPSISVDTACSSSLVSVHLAVQSLRNQECDVALAGGVNLILTPETTIAFSRSRMLSPDGRCRPFDAAANGYVRGEGGGIVVLKRLTDAVADGDRILGTIRSTSLNQDGRTSGLTAPNGQAQQQVIRRALSAAGVSPERISYIEAHGTGTPLGDPIEVDALAQMFRRRSPSDPECYVSSVKANVGHLETAAGMASLIKVLLMMQHEQIPPQLHFERLNPHIQLDGSRLAIPREVVPWAEGDGPRIAGISAFGFGGTNAHLLLQQATPTQRASPPAPQNASFVPERVPSASQQASAEAAPQDRPLHLLSLSAKTPTALDALAKRYAEHLENEPDVSLGDLCYSANTGRSLFNHRLAVVGESTRAVANLLRMQSDPASGRSLGRNQLRGASRPRIAFLFTGQGAQYAQMGRRLFETQPTFRRAIEQCDEILADQLDESLLSLLFPEAGRCSQLDETIYTQPALFAIEYALATLWRSWGVEPDVVLGHSVGEYAAACVAGLFTLEDGLKLIAARGRLMQQLAKDGSMAVVFAPLQRVAEEVADFHQTVSVAAINGPENTVISGAAADVQRLIERFEHAGLRTQPLAVSHAFHSPLMEPILDDFQWHAERVTYQTPRTPLISNLTGRLWSDGEAGPRYWRQHVRNPVRFSESITQLERAAPDVVVEIGPSSTLLGMARRCLPKATVQWLPSLRKGSDDWQSILESVSQLYLKGVPIDWQGFDRDYPRRRITLPTYPFERQPYWFDAPKEQPAGTASGSGPMLHPLLGRAVPCSLEHALFEGRLGASWPAYLADHQVQRSPVVPAAAYLELGLAAGQQLTDGQTPVLENVSVQRAMFLSDQEDRRLQVAVAPEVNGRRTYSVSSRLDSAESTDGTWSLHACGQLVYEKDRQPIGALDLAAVGERMTDVKSRDEFYALMQSRGLAYGPQFQVLSDLARNDREALARLELPAGVAEQQKLYHLHPAMLDACFQAVAGVIPRQPDGSYSPSAYLPMHVARLRWLGEPQGELSVYARRTSGDDRPEAETVESDVMLVDQTGQPVVQLEGVRVQRMGRQTGRPQGSDVERLLYRADWVEQPLEAANRRAAGEANARKPGEASAQTRCTNWLIFADHQSTGARGLGEQLAERLKQAGNRCVVVRPGHWSQRLQLDDPEATLAIDPLDSDGYRKVLERCQQLDAEASWGIVHLWSLQKTGSDRNGAGAFDHVYRWSCGSGQLLMQQLAHARPFSTDRVWLVTRGGQPLPGASQVDPDQAALWGLGRVASLEHPELRCRLVDLDPDAEDRAGAEALLAEAEAGGDEDQLGFRRGRRYVARLAPAAAPSGQDAERSERLEIPGSPFRLALGSAGELDSLHYRTTQRRELEAGQVEIEVRATGLNFSDVLKGMGLYPGITDDVVPLGIEAAGVVTAVGAEVGRFREGDEVVGVVPYSLASHAVTSDYALVHKPAALDFASACTIPVTFLTAFHALRRLARLGRGESVLIHAGAGGVGLAAIQIAQQVGAEIFATAGSERKRDFLRDSGVEHVMDSRSLDFAEQIKEITDHRGVDVVLNSLPGEAMTRSLSLLAAYGRFLEIGKTEIYQNRMIGLLPFQDNLSYFAIDLDRMLRQRPDEIRGLYDELMPHFESGSYRPLPQTTFPAEETVSAFRYMAQRKNIGKVVVSFQPQDQPRRPAGPITSEATYLISGGLGALGRQMAQWLSGHGARHLVLLSRRQPAAEHLEWIEQLEAAGTRVVPLACDVSDDESLTAALAGLPPEMPAFGGVIHAAGVLDDGLLRDMTPERLEKVMAPKAQGAWNLHRAIGDAPVRFFVMFSSLASVVGSPGQSNYAAANAYLDALAHRRRAEGRPATSIQWGPWAGAGMAAETDRAQQAASRAVHPLIPETALQAFEKILRGDEPETTVADADWSALKRQLPGRSVPSMLRELAGDAEGAGENQPANTDQAWRAQLLDSGPQQRQELLKEGFLAELARITGIDPGQLDVDQPLDTMGLDSLMALELKNKIECQLDIELPMARFLEGPTVTSLAEEAARLLAGDGAPEQAGSGSKASAVSPWSPLVLLKPSEQRPALFCVHPLGGDVRCYDQLARNIEHPSSVYALRARGTHEDLPPHTTIDEMVEDYLAAMRSVQPRGPYHLAGWSTGGTYAYALAERLMREGDALGLLAFFDTPLPSICDDVDVSDDARFLCDLVEFTNHFSGSNMQVGYEELVSMSPDSQFETILQEAKRQMVVPADVGERHIRRLVEVAKANVQVLKGYRPGRLAHPLHLFRPTRKGLLEQRLGGDVPADLGWGDFVTAPIHLKQVPGGHFTMMTGSDGKTLAELLGDCLDSCNRQPNES